MKNDNFKVIDESKIPFMNEIQNKADIAFFVDLLETYLEDLPKNLAELKSAVASKDSKNIQFYAHKLKGSMLTLGIQQLADVCFDLETAGKDNDLIHQAGLNEGNYNNFIRIQNDIETLIGELGIIKEKYSKLNSPGGQD